MLLTFRATGRAGEVALSTWNQASWDYDLNMLRLSWKNIKTGVDEPMLLCGHKSSYLLDVFFAFGIYWIYGNSRSPWIIESFNKVYENGADGALAKKLTEAIHKVRDRVEGLPYDATMKGLRSGSNQAIFRKAGIEAALCNGGWVGSDTAAGSNKGFEYLHVEIIYIMEAQLALSDVKGDMLYPPRVDCLIGRDIPSTSIAITVVQVDLWIDQMFVLPTDEFRKGGDLRQLARTCFATFLMYLGDFINDFGKTSRVGSTILAKIRETTLTFDDAKDLGRIIRRDYVQINAACSMLSESLIKPVVDSQREVVETLTVLKDEVREVRSDLKIFAEKISSDVQVMIATYYARPYI
jgi:hypothetical protein